MRVSDYIEVGVGRLPEMPQDHLRLAILLCFSKVFVNETQLFGGSAFTKGYLYGLTDYNKATWMQNFVASIAGASASLVVSAPLDVIKTRIQNRNFDNPESGFKIIGKMMKNEGFTSFFKGLTPKVCYVGSEVKNQL